MSNSTVIKKSLFLYFLSLMAVLLSWSNESSLPSFALRLGFLIALTFPFIKDYQNRAYTMPIFYLFVTVSTMRYAASYMPGEPMFLSIIFILLYFLFASNKTQRRVPLNSRYCIVFIIITLISDLTNDNQISTLVYALIMLIPAIQIMSFQTKKSADFFCYMIIASSFILSLEMLLFGQHYSAGTYDVGLERKGWTDPNYFDMVLGFGVIVSIWRLLFRSDGPSLRFFSISTIMISLYSILMTGSRGPLLALVVCAVCFIFKSRLKSRTKFLFAISVVIMYFAFDYMNMFDLLRYRIANDDGTGSDRTLIWARKLNFFYQEGDLATYLLGFGHNGGLTAGTNVLEGFHNDYIAVLVEYGALGLISMLLFFCVSLYNAIKNEDILCLSGIVFVMVNSLTLEPITGGSFSSLIFILFIIFRRKFECLESDDLEII